MADLSRLKKELKESGRTIEEMGQRIRRLEDLVDEADAEREEALRQKREWQLQVDMLHLMGTSLQVKNSYLSQQFHHRKITLSNKATPDVQRSHGHCFRSRAGMGWLSHMLTVSHMIHCPGFKWSLTCCRQSWSKLPPIPNFLKTTIDNTLFSVLELLITTSRFWPSSM